MYNTSNTARFNIDPSASQALGFLWRGRWWIVLLTILTTGLGVYYAQDRGTIWRAKSVLYVESGAPLVLGAGNLLQGQNVNYANTQAELLRSTPILEAALAREGIGGNPVFQGTQNDLAWLKTHLRLDVGEDDGLITVSLDSKYLAEACNVVNAIVDSYREFQVQSSYESSTRMLGRLTAELEKFEGDLQQEQNKLLEFLQQNPGVGVFSEASGVAIERFSELNSALTQAELAAIEAEAAWNAARQLAESPELLRQVPLQPPKGVAVSTPDNSGVLRRLRELQDRRTQLLTEVTAEHPMLAELERTVADLEQELADGNAQLAAAYASALELQFRIAEKKFEDLRGKLAEHERKIIEFDPKLAEYESLQRRVERMRLIAGTLYQRVREININQSLDSSSSGSRLAVVYEPASPQGALIASSKATVVAIAVFVGLVLGAGLSWLLSLFDQRLRTPEDVAEQLPLFSTIPRVLGAQGRCDRDLEEGPRIRRSDAFAANRGLLRHPAASRARPFRSPRPKRATASPSPRPAWGSPWPWPVSARSSSTRTSATRVSPASWAACPTNGVWPSSWPKAQLSSRQPPSRPRSTDCTCSRVAS